MSISFPKITIGSALLGVFVFFVVPIIAATTILLMISAIKQNIGHDSFKFIVYEFLIALPLGGILALFMKRFFVAALHLFLFVGWNGYATETGLRLSNEPKADVFILKIPTFFKAFNAFIGFNVTFARFIGWPIFVLLLIIFALSIADGNNHTKSTSIRKTHENVPHHSSNRKRKFWRPKRAKSNISSPGKTLSSSSSPEPDYSLKRSLGKEWSFIVMLLLAVLFGYFAGKLPLPILKHITGWNGVLFVYSYITWGVGIIAAFLLSMNGVLETLAWRWKKE